MNKNQGLTSFPLVLDTSGSEKHQGVATTNLVCLDLFSFLDLLNVAMGTKILKGILSAFHH